MSLLPNYYRWIFDRLRPWVGSRILDVGSGVGRLWTLDSTRWERLVLVDISPSQCDAMRERFAEMDGVEVVVQDVVDPSVLRLGRGAFDTIVCLDVVEHFEDDEQPFRYFHQLLEPGGHLLLKVPAHPWLYGTMDRASGHFRRYARKDVEHLARRTGFRVLSIRTMNPVAVPAWWFKGRILKREVNFSRTFSHQALRRVNRLIPVLKLADRVLPLPVGLSLVAALQKP